MRLVFLLCLLCKIAAEAYSIVFVHIGPQIPDYLPIAVEQARLFNKECPIYIIGNEKAFKKCPFRWDNKVRCITCESLPQSKYHKNYLASLKLKKNNLKKFWKVTSERFFYLEELTRKYSLTDVFHLENDVMLYVDLASQLPLFKKHYTNIIGATFDCDARCIPGFIYISHCRPLSKLAKFMASRAGKGENDMQMIQKFKSLYLGKYIDHLPIIYPEYDSDYGLENALYATTNHPEYYSQHFNDFGSIFDAAAIGQYLGGISPQNGSPVPGFINESCLFNPSYFSFEWEMDSEQRWVPYLRDDDAKYRINNLHIHCKDLKPFFSKR